MSKRKGVSADEKRTRMLQLFYEKKEFFQLKELEKLAPKEKGIIAQSVKDVITNLVDDGLVDTEKIGISVYYWAFPSKAKHSRKRKFDELDERHKESTKKLKLVEENLSAAQVGREKSSQRNQLLDKLLDLQIKRDELLRDIKKFKDNDPEVLENMKSQTKAIKDAANRWTDNIFTIKSWCKNKFNIEDSALNKSFNIPGDFDYIE